MKKTIYLLPLSIGIVALSIFFVHKDFFSFDKTPAEAPRESSLRSTDEIMLQEIIKLPLRKRIGQLMIFGFSTTTPDEHILNLIQDYGVGGVNLLKRNVRDADQVRRLARSLQEKTREVGLPPMIIAADQEGGEVVRFRFLRELTAEKEITGEQEAFQMARRRGTELRALGINMNFAPVLDYVRNKESYLYNRTFATSSKATAVLGVAMARGYASVGIIPVFKHFPGYGDILADPHRKDVKESPVSIGESLEVFHSAMAEMLEVPVMTAHIIYDNIDILPATRSKIFLTDTLRKAWGYNGVIITDDIEMVSAKGGEDITTEEIAVQAIEAGADAIISTYTADMHERIIEAIEGAVISGRISEERLHESVLRVWRLKSQLK